MRYGVSRTAADKYETGHAVVWHKYDPDSARNKSRCGVVLYNSVGVPTSGSVPAPVCAKCSPNASKEGRMGVPW